MELVIGSNKRLLILSFNIIFGKFKNVSDPTMDAPT
jgi:hypothetical protein